MTRITIEGPIVLQLGQVPGPVELCDSQGRVIGDFTPRLPPSQWPQDRCPYTEEELSHRRARVGQGGKKSEQMLKDLGYAP